MNRRILAIVGALIAAGTVIIWFSVRGSDGAKKSADTDDLATDDKTAPIRATGGGRQQRDGGELRVLIDDDPEGTLRLEGQVVAADKTPVGGAIVSVNTNPPRDVVTEQDGSFAIDKLVGRPYTLVARSPGGVAGPVTAQLTQTNEPVILVLRPAATVEVTVVDARTVQPVSSATVEVRGIAIVSGVTGSDGVARIEQVVPGRYNLVAYASGYAVEHSRVFVPGSDAAATARLALRKGARVSGIVVTPEGQPVKGATVRYQGASEWAQSADPRLDAAETDAAGKFSFEALPAGTFRFEASSATYAPGRSEMVTLDGQAETSGVKVVLEPGATLRGEVVSKRGEPVGTARVRVRVKTESMRFGDGARQTFADDEGKFEITGLPQKPVEVVAIHESASSEIDEYDLSRPPAVRDVTITLDLDGKIAGIVVGTDGEPIEAAQVTAFPDFRSRDGSRRAMRSSMWFRGMPRELTDAGGRFVISGLDEGEYIMQASRSASGRRGFRGGFRDAPSAQTGDTDVRIVLPQEGVITGKVAFKNGDPPEMFYVRTGGWGGGTPFSTRDGSFELRDVPPRIYSLTISGPGFDKKAVPDIEVKEGETADVGTITLYKGRSISGRVVTSTGRPVPEATVFAGRMLFGDGSSSSAGRGGPPQARSAKETTTGEDGEFELNGVGLGDLSIVAEHEVEGRSKTLLVQGSDQSIYDLSIALAGFGALEGRVTKGGQPAGDVIVNAASVTAPSAFFGVSTGPDGKFRFDRLAPDTYKVSAMTGRNPMRGFGFFPTVVTVDVEQTARVDLEIESGNVTLAVTVADRGGAELSFSMVYAVSGPVTATSARDLTLAIGAFTGFSAQAFSMRGNPAEVQNLTAGKYTVCAIPYPPEVQGMGETMAYIEREGDKLPVFCQAANVSESPAEQAVTIEVDIPEFVPAPAGDDLGG